MPKVEIDDTELAELRKGAQAAEKYKLQAEVNADQVKQAKAAAEKLVADHKAELTKVTEQHARDAVFTKAGIDDPKVRRLIELEHAEQAADKGEPDLAKWIDGLAADPTKAPAVVAPFLPKPGNAPAAGAGNDATGRRGTLPDANRGARAPAAATGAYTPEQIANMTDAEFKASFGALAKAHPELDALSHLVNPNPSNPAN